MSQTAVIVLDWLAAVDEICKGPDRATQLRWGKHAAAVTMAKALFNLPTKWYELNKQQLDKRQL